MISGLSAAGVGEQRNRAFVCDSAREIDVRVVAGNRVRGDDLSLRHRADQGRAVDQIELRSPLTSVNAPLL